MINTKTKNIVITSGNKYSDIDVVACATAYSEFLQLKGFKTAVLIKKTLNSSITSNLKLFIAEIVDTNPFPTEDHAVIVIDLSDPEMIDDRIDQSKVIELFDHHFGYEAHWQEILGKDSHIEKVGSCATLIYEKIKNEGLLSKMSVGSLTLLYAAIISNNLNLKAQITHQKDLNAADELKKLTNLPDNWIQLYYEEISNQLFSQNQDLKTLLHNDTKIQTIQGRTYAITQMELWDAKGFLDKNLKLIVEVLREHNNDLWFYTSPSISEGKNYLYSEIDLARELLAKAIGANFSGNFGTTDKLWLRKEIVRELQKL